MDTNLFYFINSTIANPVFDKMMPFITEVSSWLLLYIFFISFLLWKGGTKGRIAVLALAVVILITDQVSSHIIKELVGRLRPCHELDGVRLLVGCGGGKSFPSSHAANNFAAAVVLSFFYKQYKWIFFTIASMVALSRVYIGVHYPLDIIGGAIIGTIFGLIVILITKLILKKISIPLYEKVF
jgi:undecaprenyl-diphosphatase